MKNIKINRSPQNVKKTIRLIQETAMVAMVQTTEIAKELRKEKSEKKQMLALYRYLRATYTYGHDPVGKELIRSPQASWDDRKHGIDCEDFSIIAAAVLIQLDYVPEYKVIDYGNGPAHIYVIAHSRTASYVIDGTDTRFNRETSYESFELYQFTDAKKSYGISQSLQSQLMNAQLQLYAARTELKIDGSRNGWFGRNTPEDKKRLAKVDKAEKLVKRLQNEYYKSKGLASAIWQMSTAELDQQVNVLVALRKSTSSTSPRYRQLSDQIARLKTELKMRNKHGFTEAPDTATMLRMQGLRGPEQLTLFGNSGIGKLPEKLWSEREYYIVALWEQMKQDGAESSKGSKYITVTNNKGKTENRLVQGYFNSIPDKMKSLGEDYFLAVRPGYVKSVTPDLKTGVAEFKHDKGTFRLGLDSVANTAYKIAGPGALLPVQKGSNESLKKIVNVLHRVADPKDLHEYKNGVYFDLQNSSIVVTDAHILFALKTDLKGESGLVDKNMNPLELTQRYPDYHNLVTPVEKRKEYVNSIKELETYLKKCLPVAKGLYTKNNAVRFKVNDKHLIMVNAKLFLKTLGVLKALKAKEVSFHFLEDKGLQYHFKIDFRAKTEYGEILGLIMPVTIFSPETMKSGSITNADLEQILKDDIAAFDVDDNDNLKVSITGIYNFDRKVQKSKSHGAAAQAQRIRIMALKYRKAA